MSQFNDTKTLGRFKANGAIAQYLRVTIASGKVAVASGTVRGAGVMRHATFADGDDASVRLFNGGGTVKCVASEAITVETEVFAAAGGKVADTGTVSIGTALEAAAADGDVFEVLPGPVAV